MQLSKIKIKNYRLLIDAELEVDPRTTLIVGRNNTAKTSCFSCIGKVLDGETVSFDDYPLLRREDFYTKIALFMEKKLTYEDLCKQIKIISIEFLVDYSLDDPDDNLGALSPFIIDVDVDTTTALIRAEYRLKSDEKTLWALLESSYYKDGTFSPSEEAHEVLVDNFDKLFGLTVYAINPNNMEDKQVKSQKELHDLFPFHTIPAERVLGEDDTHNSSLGSLISGFFDMSEADLDPKVAEEIKMLRTIVEKANKDVQKQSDEILSSVVNSSIGFGYPNIEELKLGVTTQLSIDDQIKNQTKLSYISGTANESLPSSHNGLGYKNLIKMEFLLAAFARDVEKRSVACVPLLFIEEPESHMHPQMQTAFATYLEKFLGKLSNVQIQTFLTSHSAHIANTMEFAKVRYAQKSNAGVIYKNLNTFAQANSDNVNFIRKYLTLTKCDLFFADKAIFVEGASERLLLPDMIEKCEATGVFGSGKYPLSAQYYTLIEIGGAYAHKFIPFIEFLGVPCLILTDLDSVADRISKGGKVVKKSVVVSQGETTSNETIKWWIRRNKGLPENDTSKIDLTVITSMSPDDKTRGKCHIEFQTAENGLCGHSLEEAVRNVNRKHYDLGDSTSEEDLEFKGKSKTDFALDLICECADYCVPAYIKSGLTWLNNQRVLE
ncbi:MAG: AAA family ATPase [Erysipelotrichaceae bacterium]|nr:AAA family ATPase [Erysipelotrichaceae bacterium]